MDERQHSREQAPAVDPVQQAAASLARPSSHCRRCGRALRSQQARQRGYGTYCWRVALAQAVATLVTGNSKAPAGEAAGAG